MNKLEASYSLWLEARKRSGEIDWYDFEPVKFKLADKTFYTPDFLIMMADGYLEAHDVKGFVEDDAAVKIKCAAEKFPIKFVMVKFERGVGWIMTPK